MQPLLLLERRGRRSEKNANIWFFSIEKVRDGKIYDMETDSDGLQMDLKHKLEILKKNPEWKCEDKWEQRSLDRTSWKSNGLKQIGPLYKIDDWETIDTVTKIQVRV